MTGPVRGDIWTYSPHPDGIRADRVVIVSADGVNLSARRWLMGAPLVDDSPEDILAVEVPGHGWAHAGILIRLFRPWVSQQVGALDRPTREALDSALRVALDL